MDNEIIIKLIKALEDKIKEVEPFTKRDTSEFSAGEIYGLIYCINLLKKDVIKGDINIENQINNVNTTISNIIPDYQLALLTFYTNINNKLNNLSTFAYDKSTLNKVKDIVDEEMFKITSQLNTKILTIQNGKE